MAPQTAELEEIQTDSAIWDVSFEGIDLLPEGFVMDQGEDHAQNSFLHMLEWDADPMEPKNSSKARE
jgi:hypothetical protein